VAPAGRPGRLAEFEAAESMTLDARRRVWGEYDVTSDLSPVIKTPAEVKAGSPLFLDMTLHCDVLLDRDGFLVSYLEDLGERMAKLGSRRHARKGGYYWEYKPDLKPREVVAL